MFIYDLKMNPPFSSSDHDSLTFSLVINCDDSHAKTLVAEHFAMNFMTSTMLIIKLLTDIYLLLIGSESLPLVLMPARCG